MPQRHGCDKADAQEGAADPRERRAVREVGAPRECRRGVTNRAVAIASMIPVQTLHLFTPSCRIKWRKSKAM